MKSDRSQFGNSPFKQRRVPLNTKRRTSPHLVYTIAFDQPRTRFMRAMTKLLVASLLRTQYVGKIAIFKNFHAPIFLGLLQLAWLEIQASEEEEDASPEGTESMKAASIVFEGLNAAVKGLAERIGNAVGDVGEKAGEVAEQGTRDIDDGFDFAAYSGRGRDAGYPAPPAQIPASGTTAPGSYLEWWRHGSVLQDMGGRPSVVATSGWRGATFCSM